VIYRSSEDCRRSDVGVSCRETSILYTGQIATGAARNTRACEETGRSNKTEMIDMFVGVYG
jgi:hypothetical protein